ncbi:hypothetical protein JCM11641_001270 [Rhodosporidiobolus odoratus]
MLSLRRLRRAGRGVSLLALVCVLSTLSISRLPPSLLLAADLGAARSVLWVIAHPDDESFFFAPSILGLSAAANAPGISLLCLSPGDHDGLGNLRKEELKRACRELGIKPERCEVHDSVDLPDDPSTWWDVGSVERVVKAHVERWNIDAIVSFDDYGVSGHVNHRATHEALKTIARRDPRFPLLFAVQSTSILAKFTSCILMPFALLSYAYRILLGDGSPSLFFNTWDRYLRTRRAFACHKSQARWFRSLFVTFSRYLWYVRLERVA